MPPVAAAQSEREGGDDRSSCSCVILVTPPSCAKKEADDGISIVVPEQCFTMQLLSSALRQRLCGSESCFGADEDSSSNNNKNNNKSKNRNDDAGGGERKEEEKGEVKGSTSVSRRELELEERPISIVPANPAGGEMAGGFDVCQEYGYKYEYPEDDDEDVANEEEDDDDETINQQLGESREHAFNGQTTLPKATTTMVVTRTGEQIPYVYMLGRIYHPIIDYDKRREKEATLFWFTYRCDFPEIVPYRITSDAGWGCMLRSAQMLLAQALRVHFQSRDYMPSKALDYRRKDSFYQNILTWFADFPSATESIYSLHNMVAAGLSRYETLPGEWYGPGTACHVVKDLVARHEQQNLSMFRVHVASEGTVYRDVVHDLITRDNKKRALKRLEEEKERNSGDKLHDMPLAEPEHPLDPTIPAKSLRGEKEVEMMRNLPWDTGLLLLVPLRLGLTKFNQDYEKGLAHVFSLPQSVGVLGGRPRSARWFYGAYADGTKVLGLDPHTVQPAPRRRRGLRSKIVVDLSDEYCLSVHTIYPEAYPIYKMDPSIALGFYCRDKADFENLELSLKEYKFTLDGESPPPDIFAFSDSPPDYLSSAMDEMLLDGSQDEMDDIDGIGAEAETADAKDAYESDEDEFVML